MRKNTVLILLFVFVVFSLLMVNVVSAANMNKNIKPIPDPVVGQHIIRPIKISIAQIDDIEMSGNIMDHYSFDLGVETDLQIHVTNTGSTLNDARIGVDIWKDGIRYEKTKTPVSSEGIEIWPPQPGDVFDMPPVDYFSFSVVNGVSFDVSTLGITYVPGDYVINVALWSGVPGQGSLIDEEFYDLTLVAEECIDNDFLMSDIEYDVTNNMSSCGNTGNWKLTVFGDNVLESARYGASKPPEKDLCSEQIPNWQSGKDLHRKFCGKDNSWYWVAYAANLEDIGPVCGNGVVEVGEDCDGNIQSQQCGVSDVGVCQYGTETRTCSGSCTWNPWSCVGAVYPSAEILNSLDDDCDGSTDEDICGNGICEAGEDSNNCLADCPSDEVFIQQLAEHYAPVFYQDTHADNYLADFITSVNFDGEWDTSNNNESLVSGNYDLYANIYYSVVESDNYWFIGYWIYHPRDWKYISPHENDMEGTLLIIEKDGTEFGKARYGITYAHYEWQSEPAYEFPEGVSTINVKLNEKSHGNYIYGINTPVFDDGDGVIYNYGGYAEEPSNGTDSDVKYDLIAINSPDQLWDRRNNPETFDGDYFNDNDHKANPPWGMCVNQWFWDPIGLLDLSENYIYNPYYDELVTDNSDNNILSNECPDYCQIPTDQTMLIEDFEDQNLDDWYLITADTWLSMTGIVTIQPGNLNTNGNYVMQMDTPNDGTNVNDYGIVLYKHGLDWSNYEVEFDSRIDYIGNCCGYAYIDAMFYSQSNTSFENSYWIHMAKVQNKVWLYKTVDGIGTIIAEADYNIEPNILHHVKLNTNDGEIKIYVDDQLLIDTYDTTFTSGTFGFGTSTAGLEHVTTLFDNVEVRPAVIPLTENSETVWEDNFNRIDNTDLNINSDKNWQKTISSGHANIVNNEMEVHATHNTHQATAYHYITPIIDSNTIIKADIKTDNPIPSKEPQADVGILIRSNTNLGGGIMFGQNHFWIRHDAVFIEELTTPQPQANTYYDIEFMNFDFILNTYDVKIDGTIYDNSGSHFGFDSAITEIDRIDFRESNNGYLWVDNVLVSQ